MHPRQEGLLYRMSCNANGTQHLTCTAVLNNLSMRVEIGIMLG